jgi:UDP-N-acetylmuramoylalanine--D-glutamate ligase
MDEYAQAKVSMIQRIKPGGCFYVEENCFAEFRSHFRNQNVRTYGYTPQSNIYTDLIDVYLEGKSMFALPQEYQGKRSHHVENLLAAFSLCHAAGIHPEVFVEAFRTFERPSHRIQHVRELSGVHFYDDSKGTNIDAVIRAVQEVPGPVVLIAGGVDKGFPYVSWLPAFGGKVQAVCAIGQAKERIRNDLDGGIPVTLHDGLEEAVKSAAAQAQAGGTVLLSPGCSSFDMFRDYAHRGEEFQRIVNSIESLR